MASSPARLSGSKRTAPFPDGDDPDFTCCICSELMVHPVVAPCGHEFCQHCLVRWAQTSASTAHRTIHCPTCRGSLGCAKVPNFGVSRMLARMLQQTFPAEYAARLAAVAEEQKQAAALLDLEIEQQLQKVAQLLSQSRGRSATQPAELALEAPATPTSASPAAQPATLEPMAAEPATPLTRNLRGSGPFPRAHLFQLYSSSSSPRDGVPQPSPSTFASFFRPLHGPSQPLSPPRGSSPGGPQLMPCLAGGSGCPVRLLPEAQQEQEQHPLPPSPPSMRGQHGLHGLHVSRLRGQSTLGPAPCPPGQLPSTASTSSSDWAVGQQPQLPRQASLAQEQLLMLHGQAAEPMGVGSQQEREGSQQEVGSSQVVHLALLPAPDSAAGAGPRQLTAPFLAYPTLHLPILRSSRVVVAAPPGAAPGAAVAEARSASDTTVGAAAGALRVGLPPRQAWHGGMESDFSMRVHMAQHLVRHLYAKKPHMSEPLRKSLPEFVRGMEARLYQAASSREAYLDLSTLDARVTLMAKQQLMANRMARMAVGGMPAQPAPGAAAPA